MCSSQSPKVSLLGCISVASLLILASEVSAQNHNSTVDNPWLWVDLPDTIVTGDLALRPGQDSKSWSHDGWISYGKKASADECRQTCGTDKNCWAFTWHGLDAEDWSNYCYGRAPNTLRVLPTIFKNPNGGEFSAYKSFAGKSFPNSFNYGPKFKQYWLPETSFEQLPGVNLFAGGFSSPTTKDQSIVKGIMYVGDSTTATAFANPVIARSGAVNIGATFTEDMCIAAADYMIYLDLVAGSPSVLSVYYTFFSGSIGMDRLCLIGSQPFGSADNRSATSGKRSGVIPDIAVEPEYYD